MSTNKEHPVTSTASATALTKSGIPIQSGIQKPPTFPLKYSPKTKLDHQGDTTCTYYTEDTPAILSHAGSNSDLSILSIPNEPIGTRKDVDLSDDSSNLSGDNENILAECILSAMPKSRRTDEKIKHIPVLNRNPYPTNNTNSSQYVNISGLGARSKIPSRTQEKIYKKPSDLPSK